MSPQEEQQLARIVGRLEGKLDGVADQLKQVASSLEGKASAAGVEALAGRVDDLEATQDKRWGRDSFVKSAFGAAVAIFGLLISGGLHL